MPEIKAVLHTTPEGITRFTQKAYHFYRKLEKENKLDDILLKMKEEEKKQVAV